MAHSQRVYFEAVFVPSDQWIIMILENQYADVGMGTTFLILLTDNA